MKSSYYYFIASLPHLDFSRTKPISYSRFLSFCSSFLNDKDFKAIKAVSLIQSSQEALNLTVVKHWIDWNKSLRLELAKLRAPILGRHMPDDKIVESAAATRAGAAAKEIFALSSPLEAEEKTGRINWDYLESLELGHYFDAQWLALYSLKLQILERHEKFDRKKGLLFFHDIMDSARERFSRDSIVMEAEHE